MDNQITNNDLPTIMRSLTDAFDPKKPPTLSLKAYDPLMLQTAQTSLVSLVTQEDSDSESGSSGHYVIKQRNIAPMDQNNEMSFAPDSKAKSSLPAIDTPATLKRNESIKSSTKSQKKDRYSPEYRQEKMLNTIEQHLGSSSTTIHRFDIPRLEKQALHFLKLEDDEARAVGKNPDGKPNFMTQIIAACCYIQTKQSEKWQIPMKDYTSICKAMKVPKPVKIISLCQKWQEKSE